MNTAEYKQRARDRIESGYMSEEEWGQVLDALLWVSENEWDIFPLFDDTIDPRPSPSEVKDE